ncbi:MAG TPA: LLM class flavin-dependent oxidoreductase [Actinomycetaceae bacterium]|nr:LLM class flavin-dependent oxidoreductase [Actinomycetaceae bacterium]
MANRRSLDEGRPTDIDTGGFMLRLSILDLATVGPEESYAEALAGSVALAQAAEEAGYTRIWYAEHHNHASIASSATAVLIAHVASATESIRLGAGGIMLPNHSPLVIAEQFGTLETLHPGRIDLGLGRAPGTDTTTVRALRRDLGAAANFPDDVLELQAYLGNETRVPGVNAYPGMGTNVPLYILGSSLFGAKLAAALSLPYAFASHFAPNALQQAIAAYRSEFVPTQRQPEPYVIAGANVIAADSEEEAQEELTRVKRSRVSLILKPGTTYTDEQADFLLASPQGHHIQQMMTYTAVGTGEEAKDYLEGFAKETGADEIMVTHPGSTAENRIRSATLLAQAAL